MMIGEKREPSSFDTHTMVLTSLGVTMKRPRGLSASHEPKGSGRPALLEWHHHLITMWHCAHVAGEATKLSDAGVSPSLLSSSQECCACAKYDCDVPGSPLHTCSMCLMSWHVNLGSFCSKSIIHEASSCLAYT